MNEALATPRPKSSRRRLSQDGDDAHAADEAGDRAHHRKAPVMGSSPGDGAGGEERPAERSTGGHHADEAEEHGDPPSGAGLRKARRISFATPPDTPAVLVASAALASPDEAPDAHEGEGHNKNSRKAMALRVGGPTLGPARRCAGRHGEGCVLVLIESAGPEVAGVVVPAPEPALGLGLLLGRGRRRRATAGHPVCVAHRGMSLRDSPPGWGRAALFLAGAGGPHARGPAVRLAGSVRSTSRGSR